MLKAVRTFDEALAEVNRLTNGLTMPVDERIKPLVAALRMFDVETSMSCEGHSGRGHSFPWIDVFRTSAEPLFRLVAVQNRPWNDDGTPNENIWVIRPQGIILRLIPWDAKRPLSALQKDALDFAERIKWFARHI